LAFNDPLFKKFNYFTIHYVTFWQHLTLAASYFCRMYCIWIYIFNQTDWYTLGCHDFLKRIQYVELNTQIISWNEKVVIRHYRNFFKCRIVPFSLGIHRVVPSQYRHLESIDKYGRKEGAGSFAAWELLYSLTHVNKRAFPKGYFPG